MNSSSKIRKNRQKIDKEIFISVSFKLAVLVSLIIFVSLSSITALVSWLVSQDLRISAEESNFNINRRSAIEAEEVLEKKRSDSMILSNMIMSAGVRSALANETLTFFFKQNTRIAAVYFSVQERPAELLINEVFFDSRGIDIELAQSYMENNQNAVKRAALGETFILNATPHFTANLLALFYSSAAGAQMVLFSPESLTISFGSGLNKSYMLNNSGDILVHSNFEYVSSGFNASNENFIHDIYQSPDKNRQMLIETDFGISGFENNNAVLKQINIYFEKIKKNALPLLSEINLFFISVYEKCADIISNLLKIERNIKEQTVYNTDKNEHHTEGPIKSSASSSSAVSQFITFTKLNVGGCIVITNIEYNKVFKGITEITRLIIYLILLITLFSMILIWLYAKRISSPLKMLAAAARTVESGDFDLNLKAKGRDEIGVLTESFQKMCSALHIFGRFTNKEIALKVIDNQIKPGGLPKQATIFISDIREFSAKYESFIKFFGHEASDIIVQWLNNYFTQMIECIEKTGGTADKFIGDAVMAHWGTAYTAGSPRADAFNCIKAALMMRKSLYYMNKERKKGDPADPLIRIGCGINTGLVTACQLGSGKRMEYTVIGDPVNLTSRIEALAKPLGADILISEDTWSLVGDKFVTEEMTTLTVKGKSVRIFAVINFSGEEKGPQSLDEVRELLGLEAPELESAEVNKI
ncbi:MAG: adenylate/guanylate cyclase domain-containing protein [Treponema sp.]|nr:adenylate/guanylate cyclase domain-containing protein [Treponema sp.]